MRLLLALALVAATSVPAAAQSTARARPPGTAPLDEAPAEADAALEQQEVKTRREGTTTYTEYRVGGKLYMVKVTPAKGPSYVLIDHKGDGQFARQDSLDSGVRVPQWVIFEF